MSICKNCQSDKIPGLPCGVCGKFESVSSIESPPNTDFDLWWHNEGSSMRPLSSEDAEMHVKRICKIAWSNGVFKSAIAAYKSVSD